MWYVARGRTGLAVKGTTERCGVVEIPSAVGDRGVIDFALHMGRQDTKHIYGNWILS